MSKYYTSKGHSWGGWWDYEGWGRASGSESWYQGTSSWYQTTTAKERKAIVDARKNAVRIRTTGKLPDEVVSVIAAQQRSAASRGKVDAAYAGYDTYTFAMDVNGTFHTKGNLGENRKTIRDLHEVAESGFQSNALYAFEPNAQATLPSDAKKDAVKHYKFLRKFPRSDLFKMLLGAAGGDPDRATQLFFESNGGQGNVDDLQELADKDEQELQEMGFGKGWDMSQAAMSKFLDLKKLLRYIRKDWDFSGERTKRTRISPHPADDVSFRQIANLTEVLRAPLEVFGCTDILAAKLALRQMQVREYEEIIPGPPKRFVLLIDDSGSMSSEVNTEVGGQKFTGIIWAMAIAIAICQAAEDADNKVTIAMFASHIGQHFEGTAAGAVKFLWQQSFGGGGTDIKGALAFADSIHTGSAGPVEATIIITDGAGSDPAKPKMPLFSVFTVSTHEAIAYYSGKLLVQYSDRVIELPSVRVKEPT